MTLTDVVIKANNIKLWVSQQQYSLLGCLMLLCQLEGLYSPHVLFQISAHKFNVRIKHITYSTVPEGNKLINCTYFLFCFNFMVRSSFCA